MRLQVRLLFCGVVLWGLASCGDSYVKPDAPIQEVSFTRVHLEDGFWLPRIETNRTVSIPSAFRECEKNGRFDNFAIAGGLKRVSIGATSRSTIPILIK